MNSQIYKISRAAEVEDYDADTLIMCVHSDERAMAAAEILSHKMHNIKKVLVLQYSNTKTTNLQEMFPNAEIRFLGIEHNPISFIIELREMADFLSASKIMIDITCIRIPEIFALVKYFKLSNVKNELQIAYSLPFEYEFPDEPFLSYRSYYGNLKTTDLVGYSGISESMPHSRLLLFLGFEGMLSSKITEDIEYENLVLINNLPSFYAKYKDISIVNNYDLVSSIHGKMLFVPANNPFEIYNFLSSEIADYENVCIAPLSTKPVALGICLYALSHDNVRIVYPVSDEYNHHIANKVHSTYIYKVPLSDL